METNIFTGIAEIQLENTPHLMGDYLVYKHSDDGRDREVHGFFVLRGINLVLAMELRRLRQMVQRGKLVMPDGKNYLVDLRLIWDINEIELGNILFRFEFAPGTERFGDPVLCPPGGGEQEQVTWIRGNPRITKQHSA